MEHIDILQPLNEILGEVEELVKFAQAEEWESMETAAAKYQQHVSFLDDDTYLKAINDANLVQEAKEIIAKIQLLNEGLDTHTHLQRERIASELRQLRQGDKAMDAYGQ